MAVQDKDKNNSDQEVSNKILTIPNLISTLRLLLIPLYFYFLFIDNRLFALLIFAICASTDFLDGQIARRFNCVSKLGQLLDPAVDTLLMISGVIGANIACGLPMWVVVVIFLREALLLCGGGLLLKLKGIRIPVIYLGKVSTALLFFGICIMFLNWYGIAIVYIGLFIEIVVTIYYIKEAILKLRAI